MNWMKMPARFWRDTGLISQTLKPRTILRTHRSSRITRKTLPFPQARWEGISGGRVSARCGLRWGLLGCPTEMLATGAGRFDLDRFGAGAFGAPPRQADLVTAAGTFNFKMAARARRLYN